jgi:hypothetical protein
MHLQQAYPVIKEKISKQVMPFVQDPFSKGTRREAVWSKRT